MLGLRRRDRSIECTVSAIVIHNSSSVLQLRAEVRSEQKRSREL
jgi:hypothetical protein